MGSDIAYTSDYKRVSIDKLDPAYGKQVGIVKDSIREYNKCKKVFHTVLKLAGASGDIPLSVNDYKKLAEADNLKDLVRELDDLQTQAERHLLEPHFGPSSINSLIQKDADGHTPLVAKEFGAKIKELEEEIAAINKKKSALHALISEALRDAAKDVIAELEKLKKSVPSWGSRFPFEFESGKVKKKK